MSESFNVLLTSLNREFNLYYSEIVMFNDLINHLWLKEGKYECINSLYSCIEKNLNYLNSINTACVHYCGVDCDSWLNSSEWLASHGF